MDALALPLILFLLFFLISVAISRWIFRVNDIVSLLKSILNALTIGLELEKTKSRKTFGVNINETRKNKEETKCFLCSKAFQKGQLSEAGGEFYCESCLKKLSPELLK